MTKEEKQFIESAEYEMVLVIGNGFDLNLGLKTKYSDFINSDVFQDRKDKFSLFQYLDTRNIEQNGWIDAEIELKKYTENNPQNYFEEFIELKRTLTTHLKKVTNHESTEYKNIYTYNSRAKKLLSEIKNFNFLILNFNYTNTCEDLFFYLYNGNDSLYNNAKKRIIHVHGSIENDDIIFGLEDKAIIDEEYIFLKKSVNHNFCSLDIENILLNNTNSIFFFGYSLGITDYTYFQSFFSKISYLTSNTKKSIRILHYGTNSYYDIYKRIDEMSSNSISGIKHRNDLTLYDLQKD